MNKIKLSSYWKTNKRQIFKNWRKNEFIREKYGYSMIRYACSVTNHIMQDLVNCIEFDMSLAEIEREIYTSL